MVSVGLATGRLGRSRLARSSTEGPGPHGTDDPPAYGSLGNVATDPEPWILHVDLDAFLAAVEVRRRPELRGRPVVVGGDGDPSRSRQVVATASYEARDFGVHSGMPLARALKKCPEAVFLPSDRPAYDAASAEVMTALRSFGHPVEVWGWDEAVVGASVGDPEALAQELRAVVLAQTGLTCAVGIGETKERAKMATVFAKMSTERVFRLSSANWIALMGERPVTDLWGIGKRTGARLHELGIGTVTDLATADREDLASWFGPSTGPWLRALARGGTSRTVHPEERLARSRSKQVTFAHDLTEADEIATRVAALTEDVCRTVFAEGRTVTHVGVIVRTSTFFTQVKTGKLAAPSTEVAPVVTKAREVLGRFEITRPVRLLGVRVDLA
ncbi:DNA polymerase IV [Microlunatus aurantiacus]|uniref:DNA polymerase IV n=1 Tax=Microlunatus aurantiacus TaxID=446786 RepID=A0ABP7DLK4_9ACTN